MKEEGKTKEQLTRELEKLSQRIKELEASNAEHKQAEKELKVSEERYRNLVEHATDAIYIISSQGFEYVNSAFEKLTGFKAEEVYSKDFNFWSIIVPEDRELIKQREQARKRGERIPSRYEFRVISKYEAVKNVEATTVQIGKKGEVRVMGILRDMTEQKRIEKALKESEEKHRRIVEMAPDGIMTVDLKGVITSCNPAYFNLTGYKPDDIAGKHFTKLPFLGMRDMPGYIKLFNSLLRGRVPKPLVVSWIHKDGTERLGEMRIRQIRKEGKMSGFQVVSQDITERKRAEGKIRASLKEKELLLKEIHHRVKNNIQVITSLLSLQSMHFKDKLALEMFKSTMNRVKSMGLVHERLYKSDDLAKIDFDPYIRELATYLFQSYNVDSTTVKIKIDVKDVFLDINTAVPCALIITELISNSLKYAFPDGKAGEILLDFQPVRDGEYSLIIRDNGIEFPEDIDFRKTKSLGLQLVNMLVDQLHGTIRLKRDRGTEFKIEFKEARE